MLNVSEESDCLGKTTYTRRFKVDFVNRFMQGCYDIIQRNEKKVNYECIKADVWKKMVSEYTPDDTDDQSLNKIPDYQNFHKYWLTPEFKEMVTKYNKTHNKKNNRKQQKAQQDNLDAASNEQNLVANSSRHETTAQYSDISSNSQCRDPQTHQSTRPSNKQLEYPRHLSLPQANAPGIPINSSAKDSIIPIVPSADNNFCKKRKMEQLPCPGIEETSGGDSTMAPKTVTAPVLPTICVPSDTDYANETQTVSLEEFLMQFPPGSTLTIVEPEEMQSGQSLLRSEKFLVSLAPQQHEENAINDNQSAAHTSTAGLEIVSTEGENNCAPLVPMPSTDVKDFDLPISECVEGIGELSLKCHNNRLPTLDVTFNVAEITHDAKPTIGNTDQHLCEISGLRYVNVFFCWNTAMTHMQLTIEIIALKRDESSVTPGLAIRGQHSVNSSQENGMVEWKEWKEWSKSIKCADGDTKLNLSFNKDMKNLKFTLTTLEVNDVLTIHPTSKCLINKSSNKIYGRHNITLNHQCNEDGSSYTKLIIELNRINHSLSLPSSQIHVPLPDEQPFASSNDYKSENNKSQATNANKAEVSNVGIQGNQCGDLYHYISIIGQGAFGTVHLAQSENKYVAVKKISVDHLDERTKKKVLELFKNEVEILTRIKGKHENILQFIRSHGLEETNNKGLLIVTEFIDGRNMQTVLHKNDLQNDTKLKITLGCWRGLAFLQENNIVHRDLKPANILITKDFVPKIADFGLSKIRAHVTLTRTLGGGTYLYQPPEVMLHFRHNKKSDVYSMAATLVSLWSEQQYLPTWLRAADPDNINDVIENAEICADISCLNDLPEKIRKILWSSLHPRHEMRPSANEMVTLCKEITLQDDQDVNSYNCNYEDRRSGGSGNSCGVNGEVDNRQSGEGDEDKYCRRGDNDENIHSTKNIDSSGGQAPDGDGKPNDKRDNNDEVHKGSGGNLFGSGGGRDGDEDKTKRRDDFKHAELKLKSLEEIILEVFRSKTEEHYNFLKWTLIQNEIPLSALHFAANIKEKTEEDKVAKNRIIRYLHLIYAPPCIPPFQDNCTDDCKSTEYVKKMLDYPTRYIVPEVKSDEKGISESGVQTDFHHEAEMASKKYKGKEFPNLLSLDGGGIRGLIQIQILICIEKRLNFAKNISEYNSSDNKKAKTTEKNKINLIDKFKWVAGTSTGSILAAALCKGIDLRHCLNMYFRLKDYVFCARQSFIRPLLGGSKYESDKFEKYLIDEFGDMKITDIKSHNLITTTIDRNAKPLKLHLIRSYGIPTSSLADLKLWQAVRCSTAAPTYFDPVTLGDHEFIDGGLMTNNPTLDLLTEVLNYNTALKLKAVNNEYYMNTTSANTTSTYTPSQSIEPVEIGCVLSIGTGLNLSKVNAKETTMISKILNMLREQMGQSDARCNERATNFCHAMNVPFFRFTTPLEEDIALDETDQKTLVSALWKTIEYMYENRKETDHLIKMLTVIHDGCPSSSYD